MVNRKIIISVVIVALSGVLGALLSRLTSLPFFDSGLYHEIPTVVGAIIIWYILLLCNFLLSLSNRKKILLVYIVAAIVFSGMFMGGEGRNMGLLPTIIAGALFFLFLITTEHIAVERAQLYVKFNPSAIFLPIVNVGTVFLLLAAILIGYMGGHRLALSDPERIVGTVERLLIPVVNNSKTLLPIPQSVSQTILPTSEVSRIIATQIVETYRNYLWMIPFMTALIVALVVQPIIWIAAIIIRLINPIILFLLKRLRVIVVTTRMVEQEIVTI